MVKPNEGMSELELAEQHARYVQDHLEGRRKDGWTPTWMDVYMATDAFQRLLSALPPVRTQEMTDCQTCQRVYRLLTEVLAGPYKGTRELTEACTLIEAAALPPVRETAAAESEIRLSERKCPDCGFPFVWTAEWQGWDCVVCNKRELSSLPASAPQPEARVQALENALRIARGYVVERLQRGNRYDGPPRPGFVDYDLKVIDDALSAALEGAATGKGGECAPEGKP